MTELSPQAQAVKDAVIALYTDQQQIRDWGWRLDAPTVAAALRAIVEQLGYSNVPEEFAHLRPLVIDSDDLLAIAAELEAGND
jgi:hypothetical protein